MDITELLGLRRQEQGIRPPSFGRAAPDDPCARRRPPDQPAPDGARRRPLHRVRHHERRPAEDVRGKPRMRLRFAVPNLARFRVNAFVQSRGAAAASRTIPSKVLSLEDLNAPKVFAEMVNRPRGLVLVTGPTGSGKSTTLAAMMDQINELNRPHHHDRGPDRVHARVQEVPDQPARTRRGHPSFAHALRSALRQDPDVILVGEMRDLETIRLALTAAETGHLVLATLHTSSAGQDRSTGSSTCFPRRKRRWSARCCRNRWSP